MDTNTKLEYIYNKCKENEIYDNIIVKNIEKYNIKYSKNKNGIFLNLLNLNDEVMNIIYNSIKNNKIDEIDKNRNFLLEKYKKDLVYKNKDIIVEKNNKKFENLNEIDISIIEYSKKI